MTMLLALPKHVLPSVANFTQSQCPLVLCAAQTSAAIMYVFTYKEAAFAAQTAAGYLSQVCNLEIWLLLRYFWYSHILQQLLCMAATCMCMSAYNAKAVYVIHLYGNIAQRQAYIRGVCDASAQCEYEDE